MSTALRRRLRPALFILLPLLLLGGLWLAGQRWLTAQGIVHLRGYDWQPGLSGLWVRRLELEQVTPEGRHLRLMAGELQLDWRLGLDGLHLRRLASTLLQVELLQAGQPAEPTAALQLPQWPAWLPEQIELADISLALPCASGDCQARGSLRSQYSPAALLPASLQLELRSARHRASLQADLQGQRDDARLQLQLLVDGQPRLQLDSRLTRAGDGPQLSGGLHLPPRPANDWLLPWLARWSPALSATLQQLPASLQVDGEWSARLQTTGNTPGDWQLPQFSLQLQASSDQLALPGGGTGRTRLVLPLTGSWLDGRLQLQAGSTGLLQTQALHYGALQAATARLSFAGLQLEGPLAALRGNGSLQLSVEELQHPQLARQDWQLQAQLAGSLAEGIGLQLHNSAGLRWQGRLQQDGAGDLLLDGQLAPVALASPVLAQTFSAWPALLTFSSGQLQLDTRARHSAAGNLQVSAELQLQDASAIYDRSELHGLQAQLRARLEGEQLSIELPQLQLAQLNAGVPLGPLQLQGNYHTRLDALLGGRLQLQQLEGQLFGGQLRAQATGFDFAALPQTLQLEISGLQLGELLRAYPAEGLAGDGLLDIHLPLQLGQDGLQIVDGQLQARAPGGLLQLRSPGMRRLGQSNPALKLVATALDDFRYDQLESRVSLSTTGQLLLALQLRGRNPALEGGREVNLKVSLQEDVPALLTSLQLGERVNDVIRRRVQQRLQSRP